MAILFNPVRLRLQRAVNRLLYGRVGEPLDQPGEYPPPSKIPPVALIEVGDRISWPYPIVADKHSVGGLPLLGPLCGIPLAVVLSWNGPDDWAMRVVGVLLAFGAAEVVEFGAGSLTKVRVLLATDAASEGIDLHLACHRLVHVEVPFNPNVKDGRGTGGPAPSAA